MVASTLDQASEGTSMVARLRSPRRHGMADSAPYGINRIPTGVVSEPGCPSHTARGPHNVRIRMPETPQSGADTDTIHSSRRFLRRRGLAGAENLSGQVKRRVRTHGAVRRGDRGDGC
jgi:hypothetical protein